VRCGPEVYRLVTAPPHGVRPRIGGRDPGVTLSPRGPTPRLVTAAPRRS